jgi:hypothetical protein
MPAQPSGRILEELGAVMTIELLHVPDCANVQRARDLLRDCLGELDLGVQVVEREGDYASPTILVNGLDVMGAPASRAAACRLDQPTRERLIAALRGA